MRRNGAGIESSLIFPSIFGNANGIEPAPLRRRGRLRVPAIRCDSTASGSADPLMSSREQRLQARSAARLHAHGVAENGRGPGRLCPVLRLPPGFPDTAPPCA